MRVFLIVLDSVGIGAAPDAGPYGDTNSSTLRHTAEAVGGLALPNLQAMGLGNIPALTESPEARIPGVSPVDIPSAWYGALRELSEGKDTTTGHWELAGLELHPGFTRFPPGPPSFPDDILIPLRTRTGRDVLGNCAASGTEIIRTLGPAQLESGRWIVYTSADSVLQIAAHEDLIPLAELYAACRTARELCNPYRVGRVIARPYIGRPGAFTRTENRRDFSFPLPEPTLLDRLQRAGIETVTIGKLDDIFDRQGIATAVHVENNQAAETALLDTADRLTAGLVFANLIDFDMRYGHRRDPAGYAAALEQFDRWLGDFLPRLRRDDMLLITADHGNDPTFAGTDHTREYVPLLCYRPERPGGSFGVRNGFHAVAQTVAALFGLARLPRGDVIPGAGDPS